MFVEKPDHEAVEEPRLLDLAGVAGAGQDFQLAVWYARLEREGAWMAAVFAAGKDNHRAGDVLVMAFGVRLSECAELMNDGFGVGVLVAFGEHVGEEMRHRRDAKRGAHVFKRVAPTIADAFGAVIIDAFLGEFFGRVVAGAAEHQRGGFVRPLVIHEWRDGRAHRAAGENGFLTGRDLIDGFPTSLRHVVHGQSGVRFGRTAVARNINGDTAIPSRQMRHLINPTRLIHRIGMDKRDHRSAASHAFVVKRAVNVSGHIIFSLLFRLNHR